MPIQVMFTTLHTPRARPWPTLVVAMLLVLLGLILAVSSGPAAAQNATGGDLAWQVIEVSGDVRVRTAGSAPSPWRPLLAKDAISANAEIEAGGNGRAVIAHDGSRITISPNSQITLPDHVASGAIYRVVQRAGTMLFKIVHATKDKFQVETPYLTTVIKGTTFSVSVNGAGGSVHVTEGAVMVRPLSGEAALVTPGQTARVPADSRGVVIIIGHNGNGCSSGRAATPATDRAEKANEPGSSQGDKHAPENTQVAKSESAETGATQDASKGNAKPAAPRRIVAIIFENDKGKPANGGLKVNGQSDPSRGQADTKASSQSKDARTAASSVGDGDGNSGRSGTGANTSAAVVANTVNGATAVSNVTTATSGGIGSAVASNASSGLSPTQNGGGNANGLGNGNGGGLGNVAAPTATNTIGGALSSTAAVAGSVSINTSAPTAASFTVAPGNSAVAISGNANGLAGTAPASLGKIDNGNGNGLALGQSKKF